MNDEKLAKKFENVNPHVHQLWNLLLEIRSMRGVRSSSTDSRVPQKYHPEKVDTSRQLQQ